MKPTSEGPRGMSENGEGNSCGSGSAENRNEPAFSESALSSGLESGLQSNEHTEDTKQKATPPASMALFGFPLEFGKADERKAKMASNVSSSISASCRATVAAGLRSLIRDQPHMGGRDSSERDGARYERQLDWTEQQESRNVKSRESHEAEKEGSLDNTSEDIGEISTTERNLPPNFIPNQYTATLEAHARAATALALNPKGSRLASGGHDAEIRMWDFNGMTADAQSFRRFTPVANHGIQGLSYSPTGSHFVCAAGDAIARIYDVDGNKVQETVKGDMYVRDLAQTKGHTHSVVDCEWHPYDRARFMTASYDATVRVFDVNAKPYGVDQALPHLFLMKAVDKRNLNIAGQCRVTCARWCPSTAKFVVGGCSDGSLQLWNERRVYGKPDKVVRQAHASGVEVSGLCILADQVRFLSRAMDATMKLWDLRQFAKPVKCWEGLANDSMGLNVCVNPEESIVVTGTTARSSKASLEFFSLTTYEKLLSLPVSATCVGGGTCQQSREKGFSVTKVLWAEPLNQLITACSDGCVRIFYDRRYSRKGALLFVDRPGASRKASFQGYQVPVFTPDNLPAGYKETRGGRIRKVKLREKERASSDGVRKTTVAERPPSTVSIMGGGGTTNIATQIMLGKGDALNSTVSSFEPLAQKDPVQAIRAYAQKAQEDPIFVANAYKKTQPTAILDYSMKGGDDEELVSSASKCPRCGLKLCQCGYMKLSDAIRGPSSKVRRIV